MAKKEEIDIIAGVPSFNNQDTIAHVVKQIGNTFTGYCKGKKYLIMGCDGGSTDNTIRTLLNTQPHINKRVLVSSPGTTGKGNVFKLLFKFVKISKAKTIIVNDSDLRSINPPWIRLQLDSIAKKGFDYATPLYSRYKYDGTITKHICYPLIYGLFCRNIRQPIGGDFAFSGKLANHWLKAKWPINAKLFGIDIFMTTNAILGNFKICQVNLKSKVHDVKDPAGTLTPMLRQVTSTLFKIIITNPDKLKKLKKVEQVPILGDKNIGPPQKFKIDIEGNKKRFLTEFKENEKYIEKFLSKEDFSKLKGCCVHDRVYVGEEWWAKLVYDFIIAYKKHEKISKQVLKAFVPLWFGRVYTFIKETTDMNTKEAEKVVLKGAQEFYKQRDYLLDSL